MGGGGPESIYTLKQGRCVAHDIHKVFYEYSLRLLRDGETEGRLKDEYRF
jgi:hypothetical protein